MGRSGSVTSTVSFSRERPRDSTVMGASAGWSRLRGQWVGGVGGIKRQLKGWVGRAEIMRRSQASVTRTACQRSPAKSAEPEVLKIVGDALAGHQRLQRLQVREMIAAPLGWGADNSSNAFSSNKLPVVRVSQPLRARLNRVSWPLLPPSAPTHRHVAQANFLQRARSHDRLIQQHLGGRAAKGARVRHTAQQCQKRH